MAAEQAAEADNGARWQLEQATDALAQARARRPTCRGARWPGSATTSPGLAVAATRAAGDLSALDAALGGDGPEGVMGRCSPTRARAPRWTPATSSSPPPAPWPRPSATGRRGDSSAERGPARRRPRRPRPRPQSAADAAQQTAAVDRGAQERARRRARPAPGHLGGARWSPRQAGIEEARRQAAAEAGGTRGPPQDAPPPGQRPSRPSRPSGRAGRGRGPPRPDGPAAQAPPQPAPAPAPDPAPAPAPAPGPRPAPAQPTVSTPPPTASGADRAIAFARAQLGEPYLWAAAGPASWDCSGLTMARLAAGGGRSLPHYSVAQYDRVHPDLVEPAAPGRPGLLGLHEQPELDPPRGALPRRRA